MIEFMPVGDELKKLVDLKLLKELQALLHEEALAAPPFKPLTNLINVQQAVYRSRGEELLSDGRVGCIVVAGGQGTRLGVEGPKGCFPIMPATFNTLFGALAEKVRAASIRYGQPLKIAIMTSAQNHAATLAHFIVNGNFGLLPEQVAFFRQGQLPLLTSDGHLFLEAPGKIAFGPDGNGSCIHEFYQSTIVKEWEAFGIHFASFILIDNPLCDPFDPYLIGAHATAGVEVTLKCIERTNQSESLGLVVERKGKPSVIEYTEAPKDAWIERNEAGDLAYSIGNISLFCFSLSFMRNASEKKMPLHKAFKKTNYVATSGEVIVAKEPCIWKFERFIFDILAFSKTAQVAIYPRGDCFEPIKDKRSIEKAKNALIEFDRKAIETITGKKAPIGCLEIDAQFHYPTMELYAKWKGREIPDTPYVES